MTEVASSHNWNPSPIMAQLRRDEELRHTVYDDATGKAIVAGTTVQGNPTVGVGRNLAGKGLSAQEIEYLLGNDISDAIAGIAKFLPWADTLDDARYGCLVNMTVNMGIGGLMNFEHFLAAMKDRDWPLAAKEMLNSKWAGQVGERAQRLATQIETGTWQ